MTGQGDACQDDRDANAVTTQCRRAEEGRGQRSGSEQRAGALAQLVDVVVTQHAFASGARLCRELRQSLRPKDDACSKAAVPQAHPKRPLYRGKRFLYGENLASRKPRRRCSPGADIRPIAGRDIA